MRKALSALVLLALPIAGFAGPWDFGGARGGGIVQEESNVMDILSVIDVYVTVDTEDDAAGCALLAADMKIALDEYITASLQYQSCMVTVDEGTAVEEECDGLKEAMYDAAYEYRLAGRTWTNAGCE